MKTAVVLASVAAGMPGEFVEAPAPVVEDTVVVDDYVKPAVDPVVEDYSHVDVVGDKVYDAAADYPAVDPVKVYDETADYPAVDPIEVPSYGGESPVVVDEYVGVDPIDAVPSYGGEYPDAEPTDAPYADDEYEFDDIDNVWGEYDDVYGTVEPPKPTDVYGGCSAYDVDDYSECIDPIDYDELPVCEPVVEVEYVTSVTGTPECLTETVTNYYTEYCDQVVHETEYLTHTIVDQCEPVVEYVTVPEKYETVCKGTKTALPKTYYEYEFDYEHTVVHPIVYETEVVYATPEPEIKTSYYEETVKATKTVYETEYETTVVKETPTITHTVSEGCETVYEYKTVIPEPVVETVKKTIYVPVGCVDDVEVCDPPAVVDDVVGGDYGAVDPIDVKPSYGAEPIYDDHVHVDDEVVKPSYGGAIDDVVVEPSYGYEEPAVDPVVEEPVKDYVAEPIVKDEYVHVDDGHVDAEYDPLAHITPSY